MQLLGLEKKDYQLFMWWSDSVRDILNGMVI